MNNRQADTPIHQHLPFVYDRWLKEAGFEVVEYVETNCDRDKININ